MIILSRSRFTLYLSDCLLHVYMSIVGPQLILIFLFHWMVRTIDANWKRLGICLNFSLFVGVRISTRYDIMYHV